MNTNSSTGAKQSVNVGKLERIASILAGTLLVFKSFKNKSKRFQIPAAAAGGFLIYRGTTGHCDVYKIAGKHKLPDTVKNINIRTNVTVNRPRHEVYAFWRKLSNLPLFMEHLKRVEVIDETRSHWEAKIPGEIIKLEWDAEVVKEIEGELLGWNSLPHASIQNAGKVEFRDADENGTEIRVVITYRAPFGDVGEGITSLFNPMFEKMIKKDVKNFKRYIETGENALVEA
jgi:uncharacterized membrane protein